MKTGPFLKAMQQTFFKKAQLKTVTLLGHLFNVNCLNCGSFFMNQIGICKVCEKQIEAFEAQSLKEEVYFQDLKNSSFKYRTLYSWQPFQSNLLSDLVYFLKSDLSLNAWGFIADKFIQNHQIDFSSARLFIPIPSRKRRKHSSYFSYQLVQCLKGESAELFKFAVNDTSFGVEQKRKNRTERNKVQFIFNEEFSIESLIKAHTINEIIVIDDVMTTGASYLAIKSLLEAKLKEIGLSLPIELWVAFRREAM